MSGIQSPQVLTDLYRDLRDRRLLPLVLVLVVGMVVVPIALSSPASPVPPAPLPQVNAAAKANVPTEPITVANPGVRDYKQRLSGDSSKDPFVQEFAAPVGGGASDATAAGATTGASTGGDTTAAPTGTSGTTDTSGGSSGPQPQTQSKYYYYRLKVRAGQVGSELKLHESVGPLDPLPSKQVPAAQFLGVTLDAGFNAKTAVFLVNFGVSSVDGEGKCTMAGTYCQLLSLKPGQHEDFTWTNGVVYRIQFVNFDLVARNQLPGLGNGDDSGNGDGNSSGRYFSTGRYFSF
jgi:hypothetical protein